MNKSNVELAKNTVILGFGQLIPKFLSLIVLPILTAYLSQDEYGNYDIILSFASLLIPIMTLQIQQAVFRYLLAAMDNEDRKKYVTNAVAYVILSSVVILPISFVVLGFLGINGGNQWIICLLFFSETLYNLLGQIVRGLGNNMKYSLSVIVYSAVNVVFTVLLVAVLKWGLLGVILSLTIAYFVSDIFMLISSGMLKYISRKSLSLEPLKRLLAFSAPIVPSSIALWIVNLSDRIIVLNFLGAAANGIYAVANKIPTLYNTAYGIFNLAWTETASRVSDDGNPEEYYTRLFQGLFNFLIGVMLLMIAVTPALFNILVNGDYGEALLQIPILYFGVFFNSLVNFYSGIYIALKRTKQVGISSVVGAILNVAINLLLIDKIGLYAASISTAVSFMIIVLYRAYDLNKVIKIRYDFKNIAVGLALFVISGILIYYGSLINIIICAIIAVGYNLWKNLSFIVSAFGFVKAKFISKKK